jgi:hypothetical protein
MARYLVRRDSGVDLWMVWDREKRGPAELEGQRLTHLTFGQAEFALAVLAREIRKSREPPSHMTWQVTYGAGTIMACAHELDAKLLARELVKRGHKVSAKTREGVLPSRCIEPHQVYAWLSE